MVQLRSALRKTIQSAKEGYARGQAERREYKQAYASAKRAGKLAAAREYGRKAAYAEEKRRYQQRYEPPRAPAYQPYARAAPRYSYPALGQIGFGFGAPVRRRPATRQQADPFGFWGFQGPQRRVVRRKKKRKKQIIVPKGYSVVYK